jgi:hypothetical protein
VLANSTSSGFSTSIVTEGKLDLVWFKSKTIDTKVYAIGLEIKLLVSETGIIKVELMAELVPKFELGCIFCKLLFTWCRLDHPHT